MAEIILNGRRFPLQPEPPKSGRMLYLFRAQHRDDDAAVADAYLNLLEDMIADEVDLREVEREVARMDLPEITEALHKAAESYKVDPSSAGQQSSSPSSGGSPAGERTSRVVSFSQDNRAS